MANGEHEVKSPHGSSRVAVHEILVISPGGIQYFSLEEGAVSALWIRASDLQTVDIPDIV